MKVGDIVIAINDQFPPRLLAVLKQSIINDKIYTIRQIINYGSGRTGLLLEEIVNPKIQFPDGLYEPSFNITRFKKIDHPPIERIMEELSKKEVYLDY